MKKLLPLFLAILLLTGACAAGAEEAAPAAVPGYVRIIVGQEFRWFALPEAEPYTITIRQTDPETGEEAVNLITLTPTGVFMAESTCDNQDCVNMGEVTLENKAFRVLGNMVVCLPHQVMMELYTPDEILALYAAEEEK